MIAKGDEGFQWSWGGVTGSKIAEFEPKVTLSMESKMQGIPDENEGFQ